MRASISRSRGFRAAAVLGAAALMLSACGGAPGTSGAQNGETGTSDGAAGGGGGGDLALGLLLPYTGEYSWVGENVEEAARMLVEDDINGTGGIGGKNITLVRGDTEGTVDAGVLAARKLANTDQVVSFIGPTSLSFTGVRQVVVDTKTPVVTPTAGTVELDTAGTSLFHRTVPSDSLGGRAIAKAISAPGDLLNGESFSSVALMVGDAPALVSFEKPIQEAMESYGVPLASSSRYSTGRESYRSEVADVLRADPGMIILIGSPADSAKIMRQAQQSGYQGSWFVTQDQTNAEYVKLAGEDVVEGVYGLQEAAPAAAEGLRESFTEALGHEPDIFQTNTYDAVNVTALAMYLADKEDGEVTRDTIEAHIDDAANPEDGDVVVTSFAEGKKAIDSGDGIDYQGLSGPVDFDDYGNITSPFEIMQVQGGAFAKVSTVDAEQLK
jgi:ABC-type branched-subunit amino acid transport system substrate-binding protein